MSAGQASQAHIDAAEYVLGTLDEVSARRVEHALADEAETARQVAYWEQRLNVLAFGLAPVAPPERVWTGIEQAIGAPAWPSRADNGAATASAAGAGGIWKAIAAAASVVAVVLAALLFGLPGASGPDSGVVPAYASMLRDQQTGSSWLITVEPDSHRMHVVAMGNYAVPDGKKLRVWIKAKHGKAQLIGHFPHSRGEYTMDVSDAVVDSLHRDSEIMVSLENNSRNAQNGPSGPILWQAPVSRRTG